MAVVMVWEGVTSEQYDQVKELIGMERELAPGGLLHVAGFDEHGLHVTDVWETAEQFHTFVGERLMPGVQQIGIAGQPQIEIVPVHNLFTPGYRPV